MADPDDMSAASDEESVLGADDAVGAHVDSDDDDDGVSEDQVRGFEETEDCDMLDDDPPGDDGGVPQADPDDEEEEEDVPKKTKGGMSGIMKHFYKAQGDKTAAAKPEPAKVTDATKKRSALAASTARGAALSDPVPLGKHGVSKASKARETNRTPASAPVPVAAARAGGGGAAKKAKEPKESNGSKDSKATIFSFHDSEDEEESCDVTLPKNAGLTMSAPDAEQEFEDYQAGGGNSGTAPDDVGSVAALPCVSELAKKRRYVMKNEKVKKWAEFKCAGLRFAPDCDELFDFTLDDLTIASKKDRIIVQAKLTDEQMTKVIKTLCIGEVVQDAVGSVVGPGLSNLMAVIPSTLPLSGAEYEDLVARLGDYDEEEEELVTLVSLDHEIVKRIFLVQGGGLPSLYNPNTNSSNKYRVAAKLEENAKSDKNFTLLGVIEKAKSTRKRGVDDSSNSKSDGKRVANGASTKQVVQAAGSSAEAEPPPEPVTSEFDPEHPLRTNGASRHTIASKGQNIVIDSVPLVDAARTHCWIMGDRLYWACTP